MRTQYVLATFTLAAVLTSCSKQDAPTAAAAKGAQPTAASADLATAPLPYQRMRFVSEIEQSKRSVIARSPEHTRLASHATRNHRDAFSATRSALTSLVASAPVSVAMASAAAPSVVVASTQAAPPIVTPVAAVSQTVADGGSGHGGMVGSVVIRGGLGPNGKCDPRSDAQAAGMLAGRPNSSMPMMPSSPVFGRR